MKKLTAAVLAVILVLSGVLTANADPMLSLFFESGMELLYETSNVTLTGKADFFLDGERFKTAELLYIQDYDNSMFRLDLYTPRKDRPEGEDRHSGYTVIANGQDLYVTEVLFPGVYKTGTDAAQSTLLRRTVQTDVMADLLRILTEQAETLFGENAVRITVDDPGGMELKISLGRDVPDIVNTALNLFYQFAAKRYFEMDYDQISERFMAPMENYITIVQGLLWSTKQVTLRKAEITAKRDDPGRLTQVKGDLSLDLQTGRDGIRRLDISFCLDVSDVGKSHVGLFEPGKNGLRLKNGTAVPEEDTVEE